MNHLGAAKARLFQSLRHHIKDERVLQAMERVPREEFIPPASQHLAYEDIPLPIGEGQTISQPFIVAMMLSALELRGEEKVLEIGSGSGYQAAILSLLAKHVITVERIPALADAARLALASLGCRNVRIQLAGDALGWPGEAPYNAIIVAAGAPKLPHVLLDQLALGGRLVIPIGSRWEQELTKIVRTQMEIPMKSGGGYSVHTLGGCRFVPLIGKDAWKEEGE